MSNPYISLDEAKDQLAIDAGITIHDTRIERLIGAAIDWAENFTNRSLDELLILDSPADSQATAINDDFLKTSADWGQGYDWTCPYADWSPVMFRTYWGAYLSKYPGMQDDSKPLRRDAKEAILMMIEILFDKNPETMVLFQTTAENMIRPYRVGLGV